MEIKTDDLEKLLADVAKDATLEMLNSPEYGYDWIEEILSNFGALELRGYGERRSDGLDAELEHFDAAASEAMAAAAKILESSPEFAEALARIAAKHSRS